MSVSTEIKFSHRTSGSNNWAQTTLPFVIQPLSGREYLYRTEFFSMYIQALRKDRFSLFLNLTFGKVSLALFVLEKTSYTRAQFYKYSLSGIAHHNQENMNLLRMK